MVAIFENNLMFPDRLTTDRIMPFANYLSDEYPENAADEKPPADYRNPGLKWPVFLECNSENEIVVRVTSCLGNLGLFSAVQLLLHQ